ncbi:ABC transporter permease [Euzebya rosea]|uniref:ABC transporter permease n=1 Tax=Euzebya rosea TaxID=2052804 RepID=UPI00196A8879|nr:ABC transporter permease [Euzebya rosea]
MTATTADASYRTTGEGPLLRAYQWVRSNPWVSLLGAPVAIAALSLLLYTWVTTQELGSIEADALRAELIRGQLVEHLLLAGISTFFVIAIAIPLGVFVTRPSARRISGLIQGIASSGQAIPAYGLLVLLAITFGTTFSSAIIALVVYSILPVLRNTMVGLQQVDTSTIEAARGMGMTKRQVLRKIELPLAVPVILAGIRTALVINVGTAALAFLIGGGGLGETINTGLKLQRDVIIIVGAAMTALVALSVDWIAALVEKVLTPRGLG